ncbi:hypothetical protein J2T17_005159 [Paenibacillus mucilaginosus]
MKNHYALICFTVLLTVLLLFRHHIPYGSSDPVTHYVRLAKTTDLVLGLPGETPLWNENKITSFFNHTSGGSPDSLTLVLFDEKQVMYRKAVAYDGKIFAYQEAVEHREVSTHQTLTCHGILVKERAGHKELYLTACGQRDEIFLVGYDGSIPL